MEYEQQLATVPVRALYGMQEAAGTMVLAVRLYILLSITSCLQVPCYTQAMPIEAMPHSHVRAYTSMLHTFVHLQACD